MRKLLAVVQRQQDLAAGAQLRRHDVEQERVDADDGDERTPGVDVAHHAERVAAELLDAEQAKAGIAGRQHSGAIDPVPVEFEGFGIGRTDDGAVVIDQTHVLDGGALIDLQAELLQRRWIAADLPVPSDLVDGRRAEVDGHFQPAQRDVGQLLQPLLLLALDDGPRDKMADGGEDGHARSNGDNG